MITKHLKAYYHASGVWEQTPSGKIGIQVFRLQNSRVFLKIGPLQLAIHVVFIRFYGIYIEIKQIGHNKCDKDDA